MLIKIYIGTIIFTFLASIPYIVRLFRYDLKTDDKFIIGNIISTLVIFILCCVPLANLLFGYIYDHNAWITDEEFEKLMGYR